MPHPGACFPGTRSCQLRHTTFRQNWRLIMEATILANVILPFHALRRRRLSVGLCLCLALGSGCSAALKQPPSAQNPGTPGHVRNAATSRPDPILLNPSSDAIAQAQVPFFPGDLAGADEGSSHAPTPQAARPIAPLYDFPVVLNDRVKGMLTHYRRHKAVAIAQGFARARRYVGMMRTVFREAGLPEELVNLAFVESDVNPRATSHVNAAGIWQFMPATARLYGMRTSSSLDERRDPEKSTRAAAGYLKHLYGRFHSWPLALAAYNAGEATVQEAIKRQRTRDFWRLRLPKETRRFVPSFMAMTLIARDPKRYGFSPPPEEPYDTERLHIAEPTEIRLIAEAAGTSVRQLRELNPELVGSATPSDRPTYALRIPRRVQWISHRVHKGETLALIAKRYQVSVQVLREMNGLSNPEALRPGGVILVPTLAPSPPA